MNLLKKAACIILQALVYTTYAILDSTSARAASTSSHARARRSAPAACSMVRSLMGLHRGTSWDSAGRLCSARMSPSDSSSNDAGSACRFWSWSGSHTMGTRPPCLRGQSWRTNCTPWSSCDMAAKQQARCARAAVLYVGFARGLGERERIYSKTMRRPWRHAIPSSNRTGRSYRYKQRLPEADRAMTAMNASARNQVSTAPIFQDL